MNMAFTPGSNTLLYLPLTADTSNKASSGITTTNNGVSFTKIGKINCAYFNGTSNYIKSSNYSFQNGTTVAWIYVTPGDEQFYYLYDKAGSLTWHHGFYNKTGLNISYGHAASATSTSAMRGRCDTGKWVLYVGKKSGSNYTAMVYNSDTPTYITGGNPKYDATSSSGAMYIGCTEFVNTFWKGYISEFIEETKVRTDEEIAAYFNSTKGNYWSTPTFSYTGLFRYEESDTEYTNPLKPTQTIATAPTGYPAITETVGSYLNRIASGWQTVSGYSFSKINIVNHHGDILKTVSESYIPTLDDFEDDGSISFLFQFKSVKRIIKKLYHMGVEYKIKGGKPTPSYKTYTVTFDQVSSPTSRNPIYSDDAVGLTAGSTEFDTFFGYSGVRLNGSGVETASVTQTESGGAGKLDITKLGTLTSGDNVMIKFPLRGVKMSTSGTKVTISITDDPNKEGFQYYAFTKDGDINNPGTPKSCFYLGAYLSSSDGAKSLSGATPTGSKTQGAFITAAKTNGTNYNIMSFYQREYINALYMMKYGNPDSQTVIGKGYTNSSDTTAKATGGTNSNANSSYGTTSDTVQAKLFGLEDWWGNMYQWCGGMYTDANKVLYASLWNYDGTVSGGVSTGTIIQHTGSNYCLSAISGNNKAMFMPTATVSNSSYNTYRSDYAYVDASCLAHVGGYWTNGSIAGAFFVNVRYSASGSTSSIGSRLCFLGA